MKLKSKFFKFFLVSLCLSMLLLSSCSGGGGSDSRGTTVELEYASSSVGPVISEVSIDPRDRLEEVSPVLVNVHLENKGSQDLSQGEVSLLVGYDASIVDFGDASEDGISLLGYNDRNPAVEEEFIEFEGYIGRIIEETRSEVEVPLFVKAEFSYSTVLEQEVCINPDLYNFYDGNCKNPDGEVRANAQYSPVVVSGFEQLVSERLGVAYFTFHIENRGKGTVERITVTEAALTTEDMSCEFKGEGKMDNYDYVFDAGESYVELECEHHFDPNDAAMEKVLYLDLFYDYVLQEEVTLTVVGSNKVS